jgi:hypothetical protein
MLATALTVSAILFAQIPANAWNSTGHRIISYIAYDQLEPEVRDSMVELLKENPRYEKDFENQMPDDIREGDEETRNRWIFIHASTWPDIVKNIERRERDKYSHNVWHYINLPLYIDLVSEHALSANLPVNLSTDPNDGTDFEKFNVLQALAFSVDKMKDSSVSKSQKAIYLCWILHLAGDSHQPLHSTALFTKKTFPRGDKGGNDIKVGHSKLHSLWDGFLGSGKSLSSIARTAHRISRDPELKELGKSSAQQLDFKVWIDESHVYAKSHVYVPQILEGIMECECEGNDLGPLDGLTNEYYQKAGAVASKRAAQAGWRLAELIKSVQ